MSDPTEDKNVAGPVITDFALGKQLRFALKIADCVAVVYDLAENNNGMAVPVGVIALGILYIWHELQIMRGTMEARADGSE